MKRQRWQRWLRVLVLAAMSWATALAMPATAAGADTDPSDLWWNAAESGWGMQLVQGGSAVFATLFVYDAAGKGTFFTATLALAGGAWEGPLYQTSGPYFAGPTFDPAKVAARTVGSLRFVPASAETGALQYTVDGAMATKNVQRQLLRYDDYSGRFTATVQRVTSRCSDATANGDRTLMETLAIAQSGTVVNLEWTDARRACVLSGNYNQAGKLGFADTAYACGDGEEGALALFELTKRDGFIAGRFQGHSISNGCDYRGQFTGLRPN